MSRPVVVGYTATSSGRDAVAFGARLARSTSAPLHLVMVLPTERQSVITPPSAGYEQYLGEQAETWLAEAAQDIAGIDVTTDVRDAESFAEGLVAAAKDHDAAVIVVGPAGSGRGKHRLGSTAGELLHSSDVPVAIVPRGARKLDAALPVSRVTAAVGTRPGADVLIEETVNLAEAAKAEVRLLSIATIDLPASLDTGAIRVAGRSHAELVLEAARADLPDSVAVEVVVAPGDTVEDAVSSVEWDDGDVALVGSSRLAQPRRLFLGSTASKMLHTLPVPMIVVPRTRKG